MVASLRHACAIIILSNQRPFVYIEKVLDLWDQLIKNGGKNKSVAFIILFNVFKYIRNDKVAIKYISNILTLSVILYTTLLLKL